MALDTKSVKRKDPVATAVPPAADVLTGGQQLEHELAGVSAVGQEGGDSQEDRE